MGFMQMKCPTCGANISLEESRTFCFCTYCGTKVFKENINEESHRRDNVEENISNDRNLMLADQYLEQGDFGRATTYYSKALDSDPKSADVYWKMLLCKLNVQNNEQLLQKYASPNSTETIILQDLPEYANAIRYGTVEQVEEFLSVNRQFDRKIEDTKTVTEMKSFQRKNCALYFLLLTVFYAIGFL